MDFVIDQIKEKQTALLESKGYDELSLDSPDYPGYARETLCAYIDNKLPDAFANKVATSFNIELTGLFNKHERKDIVYFNLGYAYQPEDEQFRLREYAVVKEGKSIYMKLDASQDLPAAKEGLALIEREILQAAQKGHTVSRQKGTENQLSI
jgi:hypothetical protein